MGNNEEIKDPKEPFSQQVAGSAKRKFIKLTLEVASYATENNLNVPDKGDVLAKIINSTTVTVADFFPSK